MLDLSIKRVSKTYDKYFLDVIDGLFAKFHHPPLNTFSLWKGEIRNCVVAILHHFNKLWLFYLIERLIACNNPTGKKLFKPFWIPRFLEIYIRNRNVCSKKKKNTAAASRCWLNASFIPAAFKSSIFKYSAWISGSNGFSLVRKEFHQGWGHLHDPSWRGRADTMV